MATELEDGRTPGTAADLMKALPEPLRTHLIDADPNVIDGREWFRIPVFNRPPYKKA